MTRVLLCTIFLVLCISGTLASNQADKQYSVDIHLQAGFRGESVKIFLDEDAIYVADRVLSKPSLDYAGHVVTKVLKGSHTIKVFRNSELLIEQTLTINCDVYLGVNIRKGVLGKEKASIEISYKPFIYD